MGDNVSHCASKFLAIVFMVGLASSGMRTTSTAEDTQKPGSNLTRKQAPKDARRKTIPTKDHRGISIQSEDGDIIDCVDLYKQPAFNHPLLRNHTIQLVPTFDQPKEKNSSSVALIRGKELSTIRTPAQLWKKNASCPKGTVPIRRVREKESRKPHKMNIQKAKKSHFFHVKQLSSGGKSYLSQVNHSLAILLTEGYSYSGAKGDIKVWNPSVESDDEYSTSQVGLKSGPYYEYESVESGWAVNPAVYGDRNTRLFIYWTVDASKETGCFDLTCPGFIQTNNEIALGGSIYPISVAAGLPYQITIYIYRDPMTRNWWLQYGEAINIGYWPSDLFNLLGHNAETVQWGGEVYSSKLGRPPHTRTDMGNGQFPDPISGNSGSIKRMRVRENSILLKFPEWVDAYADEYNCYNVAYLEDYIEDPEFYYGGPGKNPMCA